MDSDSVHDSHELGEIRAQGDRWNNVGGHLHINLPGENSELFTVCGLPQLRHFITRGKALRPERTWRISTHFLSHQGKENDR